MRMNISSKGTLAELDIMLGIINTCLSGVQPSARKRPSAHQHVVYEANAEGEVAGFDYQSPDFKCVLCNDAENLHHYEDCNLYVNMKPGQNICTNCGGRHKFECLKGSNSNNPNTEPQEELTVEEFNAYFGYN